MEKKTIGTFIAVLRKANGMTQQELADKLNISNKAVSRWERNECAPDISLIPALAEIFDVTCDELLKGERISCEPVPEKNPPKAEKQLKAIINRSASGFRMSFWISMAVAVAGLVCMFGISYGFYRPVIGFSVMMLFEVASFVIAVIGLNKARDVANNELFEDVDETTAQKFCKMLGSYSFITFFTVFASIAVSIPLIPFESDYIESVTAPDYYFTVFSKFIFLPLVIAFIVLRSPYMRWITSGTFFLKREKYTCKNLKKMNVIQFILIVSASVIGLLGPYLRTYDGVNAVYNIVAGVALGCMLSDIIIGINFIVKYKEEREILLFPSIRNMLYVFPAFLSDAAHDVQWTHYFTSNRTVRYDEWNADVIYFILCAYLFIFLVFEIIIRVKRKKAKKDVQ